MQAYECKDAAGRRTLILWQDGFYASYGYDNTGNMTFVGESAGTIAAIGYDDLGRRTSLVRGNGVVTTYGYDGASNLVSQSLSFPNPAGNLALGFAYNPAGQIVSTTRSNDAYAWTGAVDVDRPYGVNGLDQYASAGATSFGYDARGNLTVSGVTGYGYSSENRLTGASGGAILVYDPVGRLLQSGSSTSPPALFGYDGSHVIAEYDASHALTKRYVWGPGADEPLIEYDAGGNRTWLVADERGSIVARADPGGTAVAINRYDEYGIPQSTNTGRFQYTGQAWLPELGMYHYKARMYSPTLGRFMQTDPIGYGDGLNWYNYTGSDPVNAIDPSGTVLQAFRRCDAGSGPSTTDSNGDTVVTGNCTTVYIDIPGAIGGGGGVVRGGGPGPSVGKTSPITPQSHPCPKSGRITLSGGFSGTGFLGLAGGSAGVELGISIPTDFLSTGSLRGTQIYLSGSATILSGLGGFIGAGPTPSVGYSPGPIRSGITGGAEARAGAAWGAGGEIAGPITKNGFAGGGSVSGGPRAGYGLYAAGGPKGTATLATPQLGCTE